MTTFCMLGSLALGLLAWCLPVNAMIRRAGSRKSLLFFSIMACACSLGLQVLYFWNLIRIRDYSAMEDTSRAVGLAAAVLVTMTLALNVASLLLEKWRKRKNDA